MTSCLTVDLITEVAVGVTGADCFGADVLAITGFCAELGLVMFDGCEAFGLGTAEVPVLTGEVTCESERNSHFSVFIITSDLSSGCRMRKHISIFPPVGLRLLASNNYHMRRFDKATLTSKHSLISLFVSKSSNLTIALPRDCAFLRNPRYCNTSKVALRLSKKR